MTPTQDPGFFAQLLERIGSIGHLPEHDAGERLRRRLLVYMGVLMSMGGLLWGAIAWLNDLRAAAAIPWGYGLLTALNLRYFHAKANFDRVRFVQVLMSLLLPFLFQIALGGFSSSGVVMLWSMLAIVGALTFSTSQQVLRWLVIYSLMTIGMGLLDPWARATFPLDTSADLRVIFSVTNIVIISNIVFGLTIYLLARQEAANLALEQANLEVTQLNERLEALVAARTRDLRSTLGQLRAIIDNMPNALVAVGRDGEIQAANRTMESLFALQGTPVGAQASTTLPPVLCELVDRSIATGAEQTAELPLHGDRVGVAVAAPMHVEEEAEVAGCVVIVRDVTLEKEVDRMKTDFIATVSHELRTPLTSVLGFAKVTRGRLETVLLPALPTDDRKVERASAQVMGNLDIIVSEGERLTSLISDVLDISKMEAGHVEWQRDPIEPSVLVSRAVTASAGLFTDAEANLRAEIDDDLPNIVGDFDRLLQVLINLVSNAAKFTDTGTVTVSVRRVDEGVEFRVRDSGAGIAAADLHRIFERFRQGGDTLVNKPRGTGLGLPISQQIVLAHGGQIRVESTVGVGSEFWFVLPASGRTGTRTSASRELVSRLGAKVREALAADAHNILVVDDNPNLRELLRQQLGELGYHVLLANDGLEGVRLARTARPDLIILDIMMPEISGFDVAAMLKSDPDTRAIPILVLTIVEDAERGYRIGVDSYLQKPHDIGLLAHEIERVLKGRGDGRRAMIVSDDADRARLRADVEAQGYEVVCACDFTECVETLRRCSPDFVLVDAKNAEAIEMLHRARRETRFEHACVIRIAPGPNEERPHEPEDPDRR